MGPDMGPVPERRFAKYELKRLAADSVERTLRKAERYRLLREL